MLNIFRLPTTETEAQNLKEMLTSKRGSVEMFNKIYDNPTGIPSFKTEIGASDKDKKIKEVADLYEISDLSEKLSDKIILSSGIVNTLASESKNYKILKWKTIQ